MTGPIRRILPLLASLAAMAAGCAGAKPPLYEWHGYEASVQATKIAHDDAQASSGLEETVRAIRSSGNRPPPGVFAEYGFLLYKRGDAKGAIEYFQREANAFPEAKPLMDRLIAKVQQKSAGATSDPEAR
jgi:hypothetical protein